jgi:hypothetical protein
LRLSRLLRDKCVKTFLASWRLCGEIKTYTHGGFAKEKADESGAKFQQTRPWHTVCRELLPGKEDIRKSEKVIILC